MSDIIKRNEWDFLKEFTDARIALGRAGSSLNTNEMLKFQLAHAQAKDAVNSELDVHALKSVLQQKFGVEIPILKSKVKNRTEYLNRPDFGRILNDDSRKLVENNVAGKPDLALLIADGFSAQAIETNITLFLEEFLPLIKESNYSFAIFIVSFARVAISDPIGELAKAKMSIIFIGERPGLSSPDSMGIYITYNPKTGTSDELRNCISNIRPRGLTYKIAASTLFKLVNVAFSLKLTGVKLKDESYLVP